MFSTVTGNEHVLPGVHLGVNSGNTMLGNLSGRILITVDIPDSTSEYLFEVTFTLTCIFC